MLISHAIVKTLVYFWPLRRCLRREFWYGRMQARESSILSQHLSWSKDKFDVRPGVCRLSPPPFLSPKRLVTK